MSRVMEQQLRREQEDSTVIQQKTKVKLVTDSYGSEMNTSPKVVLLNPEHFFCLGWLEEGSVYGHLLNTCAAKLL